MLNTAIFNGRLTATPEIKVTASGKAYTRFTIAVERPYKNKDNGRETDFFTCSTFGALAKIITDHFKKGEGIIVKGPLRNVRFTTKEGEIVNSSELLITEFDFPVARPQEKSATIAKALSESGLMILKKYCRQMRLCLSSKFHFREWDFMSHSNSF